MSGIKNTNQKVTSDYADNYVKIFGDVGAKSYTGTYVVDSSGKMMLVDKNIPSSVRDKMEPLTSTVGSVGPINIKPKEI